MDPSALIFIALAVAWAIYLIPKALEHHEESVRTRTVDRFSATMRVLARREPVSRRRARLVPTQSNSRSASSEAKALLDLGTSTEATPATPATPAAGAPPARTASATAATRRLRVLTAILVVLVAVVALAAFGVIAWPWVAAPAAVLVAWLVACRLMVKHERRGVGAARPRAKRPTGPRPFATRPAPAWVTDPAPEDATPDALESDDADATGQIDAVPASASDAADPESWDPVPVTLPTYVSKPVAPRSVSTIDLDSTGVWSSGRSESDSELVRESQARDAARRNSSERSDRRHA